MKSGIKYSLIIGVLILIIIAILFIIIRNYYNENKQKYYNFPEDFTLIECINTNVTGDINATCFISMDNNSIVVKQGNNYSTYTKKLYEEGE